MELEEAIKTAIEFETKVRDVYSNAEQNIENPVGKRVLGMLAKEEQGHLDYLNTKLEEWHQTGKVSTEHISTVIPSKEVIDAKVNELEDKVKSHSLERHHDVEIRMLRNALEVETETSEFYKRMVNELPDEFQPMFSRFVEIEEGHKAIVQAELDYVNGPGYWFDFREFDLSGG